MSDFTSDVLMKLIRPVESLGNRVVRVWLHPDDFDNFRIHNYLWMEYVGPYAFWGRGYRAMAFSIRFWISDAVPLGMMKIVQDDPRFPPFDQYEKDQSPLVAIFG